jgi:hypothetical protein
MEQISCPETSVQNYHSTLRNIKEERRFHDGVEFKSARSSKPANNWWVVGTVLYEKHNWRQIL